MEPPRDYDSDPGRYRLGVRLTRAYARSDLYAAVAARLRDAAAGLVLDVGCGEGVLRAALTDSDVPSVRLVGLDRSPTMLAAHPAPAVRGTAVCLPFGDGVFDAVVAINMLYHLPDPAVAIREARRVLRAGGLFLAVAISRHDSPELAGVWVRTATGFDAEEALAIVAEVFPDAAEQRWDAPLVILPDAAAVRDYLVARHVPPDAAAAKARLVPTPLTLTKRGALISARNR